MKEIITNIKIGWKELPNSVKFWNGLVLLGLIITGIINVGILMIVWCIGSIILVGLVVDGEAENHVWGMFMPITWVCTLLVGIGFLLNWIYNNTILNFNNWLNKK
jgi:hypothetical protein